MIGAESAWQMADMLKNAKLLHGIGIQATDGELGSIDEIYFDDQNWAIRYFTVDTEGWLGGRQVLISPAAVTRLDWGAKLLYVTMTRAQIENSPGIEEHQPVSMQQEEAYAVYNGLPGSNVLSGGPVVDSITDEVSVNLRKKLLDSHLRSYSEVIGYYIEAVDGEIGHVDSLIVDDESWTVRYLEIGTRSWWPGKKVLVSPEWVQRVSWEESKVYVGIDRQAIQDCEEFDESTPIARAYEQRIFAHYGKSPYWAA